MMQIDYFGATIFCVLMYLLNPYLSRFTLYEYHMGCFFPLLFFSACFAYGAFYIAGRTHSAVMLMLAVAVGTFSYSWAYSQVSVQSNVHLMAGEWINRNIHGSIICTRRYPIFFRTPIVSPAK